METLPVWVLVIYYLFLLTSLLGILFSLFQKKFIGYSLVALLMLLTAPLMFLWIALGRAESFNEFEWLINQIGRGSIAAIYPVAGFLYLFFWWGLILKTKIKSTQVR
ncbi:hypothetical protein NOM01_07175 [Sporolactobacillus sp. STSJ-5]|uniref:hypothetical protein n=1 Tax=Sporolactobacillus sp. STSJ-5 TaxID=2965076 RepID=UPI002102695B|nr:hypothetical protein [Sporolactobacillus sp. STSJ-5]MCQ2009785.1 hypothetical protein [Sporolactobacillus sp. STSJ-5]